MAALRPQLLGYDAHCMVHKVSPTVKYLEQLNIRRMGGLATQGVTVYYAELHPPGMQKNYDDGFLSQICLPQYKVWQHHTVPC